MLTFSLLDVIIIPLIANDHTNLTN